MAAINIYSELLSSWRPFCCTRPRAAVINYAGKFNSLTKNHNTRFLNSGPASVVSHILPGSNATGSDCFGLRFNGAPVYNPKIESTHLGIFPTSAKRFPLPGSNADTPPFPTWLTVETHLRRCNLFTCILFVFPQIATRDYTALSWPRVPV